MIKKTIIKYLQEQISTLINNEYAIDIHNFIVDRNKDINNGDFYTNIAMTIAKKISKNPMELANEIKEKLISKVSKVFEIIEVAKPGYLNFFLSNNFKKHYLNYVLDQKNEYGNFHKKNITYNIEFVSANPTGFLHIGHARNAALGMTLSNIWQKYGIDVEKEYYINDAGNQINILGISVFLRYLELCGIPVDMEKDYYKGNEIIDIARKIYESHREIYKDVAYNDEKILDEEIFSFFKDFALNQMLIYIKEDLNSLGIEFDTYFSERTLYLDNKINDVIENLGDNVYEHDNALWLKTSSFGDDKDRVLIKSNGDYTYFLPDIAYHFIKITRNPSVKKIYNIWGADHKSYVDRMRIALECLGFPKDIMEVIIMQMVRLTKNGEEFKMSKRSGNSLTLKDLLNAIGKNSSRWALVSQTASTQIDIDVDKFKNQTHDNNLYYVLYAYARICQVLNKINHEKLEFCDLSLLNHMKEKDLINHILYFPCIIENISSSCEVNKITNYLYNLSQVFHSYYNEIKIIDDLSEKSLQNERILLLKSLKYTIFSGLQILNIKPHEKI